MDGPLTSDLASAMNWERGRALANGIELAWEATGPERGEPLLLVMGLSCQLLHWPDALCGQLAARGFRVIRCNNRDIGLSGDGDRGIRFNLGADWLRRRVGLRAGPANYTLHDMAADTVGLLDALGIARVHLVGASMGGMIAQIVAGRFPARVLSLTSIMSGTNHPRIPATRVDLLWRLGNFRKRDHSRAGVARRYVETMRIIGSPGYRMPDAHWHALATRAWDRAYRPGGILRQTHAIVATGSFEDVHPHIVAPTQVIHGLSDPLVRPICGLRTAKLIRNARLELIDGMGHDCATGLLPRWAELIADNAARA
jgi:pimeloyl-ACP methyl ester carboxylesterase